MSASASLDQLIEQLRGLEYSARVARLPKLLPQKLVRRAQPPDVLHIVFVMAHVGVTGGAKVIFEHANRLSDRGVKTTIVCHFPPPEWFALRAEYVQVPFGIDVARGIPACDVIVATYHDHVHACVETGIAPVIYFEQGDFHLYEEITPEFKEQVHRQLQCCAAVTTVAKQAANLISERYGRKARVFPNAIDPSLFRPRAQGEPVPPKPYMLMLGADSVPFKGTADVLKAYHRVREAGHDLDLVWVSPTPLQQPWGTVYVQPPQGQLGELFRNATVFVSGSKYETFPLPPLEAMASGCPVVSTSNRGVLEYGEDGRNCLLANVGDAEGLARQVLRVLAEPALAEQLCTRGLETAQRYSWDVIIAQLHDYLKEVGAQEPKPMNSLSDWSVAPGVVLRDPDGQERLTRTLLHTAYDAIELPVVYEMFEGHSAARWEIIARRRRPRKLGEYRMLAYVKGENPRLPYMELHRLFTLQRYGDAAQRFAHAHELAESPGEKALYLRWVALSMIETGDDALALEILNDAIPMYPDNADIEYIRALALTLAGQRNLAESLLKIRTLGEGVAYPEFFVNVYGLALERLSGRVADTEAVPLPPSTPTPPAPGAGRFGPAPISVRTGKAPPAPPKSTS